LSESLRRAYHKVVPRKKKRSSKKIQKPSEETLAVRSLRNTTLDEFIEKRWLMSYFFSKMHGEKDKTGIDLFLEFFPQTNGRGVVHLQEKSRMTELVKHIKKYPLIPAYLLRKDIKKEEIEWIFVTILTKCCRKTMNKNTLSEMNLLKNYIEARLGNSLNKDIVIFPEF